MHAKLNKNAQKIKNGCTENYNISTGQKNDKKNSVQKNSRGWWEERGKIQAKTKIQLTKILYCKVCINHLENKSFR